MNAPPAAGAARRPNAVLTALLTAVGSYTLMQTMVIPALPVLTDRLHTDAATAGWLITAFLLGSAVLTPVVSTLGDRYGHRRMLLITLAVYLASTAGAALATDIGTLIVMRALEGVSMASLPLALAVIREVMPPERIAGSFGVTAAMLGGGAGAGLVIGGVLVEHASWRWMFGAETAVTALALAFVAAFVPETPRRTTGRARVDLLGAAVLAGALSALLLAITRGSSWGWTSPGVLGLFCGSAALFLLLALVETRQARPLVDLRLLAHLPMLVTNLAALLVGVVPYFFYVLIPQLLQTPARVASYGHGLSVVESGLLMLPGSLFVIVGGRTAPWLRGRLGPRAPLAACMALMTAGAVPTALWHSGPAALAVWFSFVGLGSGYGFAALAELVAGIVPREELAAGNGLNTVVRTVGSAIGGQLSAALLQGHLDARTRIPTEQAFTSGFWLAAGLGALGIVLTAALHVRPYRPAASASASAAAGKPSAQVNAAAR